MKITEYLRRQEKEDPEFKKFLDKEWFPWTPPVRKVDLYIDANIPKQTIQYLKGLKWFRVKHIAKREGDPAHYSRARQMRCVLLTLDEGFWRNDKKFSLHLSPGVVVIAHAGHRDASDITASLMVFIVSFGLIDAIGKIPGYLEKMKIKVTQSGFVIKSLTHKSKKDILHLEY